MVDGKKIGEGHAQAWGRAGFKELAQVLPAFPGHAVQPVEEIGLAGNPTQSEINDRNGSVKDRIQEMRAASPPREEKTPDREMDR